MPRKLACFIDRLATGRNFTIMIIIWLVYALFVMGSFGASSSENVGPIDLTFAPSSETICQMIAAYGEDVRQDYMRAVIIWDGFYPLIYGAMLLLGFSYVTRQAGFSFIHRSNFLWAPLIVMGADYCENTGIVTLLSTYPSCSCDIAMAISVFVTLKWVMTVLCFVFLITVFIFSVFRRIRGDING